MNPFTKIPTEIEEVLSSRRNFLKTSGLFVVTVGAAAAGVVPLLTDRGEAVGPQAAGLYPDPNYLQLDSWIAIHENNTATFYVGKTDCGQGTGTAFRQMMADELDIAYDKTTCIMGAPTSPSIKAAPAVLTPFKPTACRCGALPLKRDASCSTWHPRD
jgi:hypothetical protein